MVRYVLVVLAVLAVSAAVWGQDFGHAGRKQPLWGTPEEADAINDAVSTTLPALLRRIDALERQMAYMAWERRYREAEARAHDRLLREWFGPPVCGSWVVTDSGSASVAKFAEASAAAEVGPCPPWPWPWPWSVPAAARTTGAER